jgi:diguanylate cyclase (GGDEF)-like protein/PAS domain S-box-containing protein
MLTSELSATTVRRFAVVGRVRAVLAVAFVVAAVSAVVVLASFGYRWAPAIGSGVLAAIAVGVVVEHDRRALAAARSQFAIAFLHSPSGLAIVDADGRVERTNSAFAEIFGLAGRRNDLASFVDLFPPSGRDAASVALRAIGIGRAPGSRIEVCVPGEDGDRWLLVVMTPLHRNERHRGERPGAILVQLEETTERRAAESILVNQSARDALTGLGNRTALFRALDYAVASGSAPRSTVIFVDLDRFKWVNDTLGHAAGDAVLVETASRLRALVRPGDLVTRVGGDEFVVVLRELHRAEDARDVAERVVATLREPMRIEGHDLTVCASVGISIGSSRDDTAQSRLADADTAMYRAKQAGGNRVELFTSPMRRARERHLQIDSELRAALRAEELDLHFQPIVNLRTGTFDGVEALLRWPARGEDIEAAIAVAEESELIVEIGEWVLAEAMRRAPGCLVGVNVSVRQLIRPMFTDSVLRMLAAADISPERLCIEVTETAIAENVEAVVAALQELRAAGVKVAIDDFGTGHASLTYLAKFPVDIVKIDRSFVHGLGNDAASGVIVRSVAAMAHALGMTVIAEGIENLNQLEIVLEAGCDAAQGYLFSRPVPRQQCVEALANAVPWPVGFSGSRANSAMPGVTPVDPARRYRLLLDLARDITGRLNLEEALASSFHALRQLLVFGGGSIQLVDGDVVRLAAADPPATPDAYETLIPIGKGIGGRIVASGEPRYIPDILRDPDVPSWRATSAGVRSYFGVPLITEGTVIGVMQIDSAEIDPWSEEDRFMVLAFTPIVAAAIQNARLFEREAAHALLPRQRDDERQPSVREELS